jgi:type IV pilus assembly protein PilM
VGERFCGHCGTNIQQWVHLKQHKVEDACAQANQLRSQHQYQQALLLLSATIASGHARIEQSVLHASQLIDQIAADRDEQLRMADGAIQSAKRQFSEHAYQTAVESLEQIPPPLRNEECQKLLGQARESLDELQTLRSEIRAAIHAKRTAKLLAKVARVLALDPNDSHAALLARKLAELHCKAARKQLTQHRYQDALALLRQIPDSFRTPEAEKLGEFAAELAYLMMELTSAPYVDKTLLAAAGRLIKLDPRNAAAKGLCEKLRRQTQRKNDANGCRLEYWSAAPAESHIGVRVDRIDEFRSIRDESVRDQPAYTEGPARFAVACGLALQGLEKVPIRTNLLPREKKGLWSKLGPFMQKTQSIRSALGIDLSATSIKAVKLVSDGPEDPVQLEACHLIEHSIDSAPDLGDAAERRIALRDALEKLFSRTGMAADRICVGVSDGRVLGRFFALPPIDREKIGQVLLYEVKQQIPFPVEELVWDYHVLPESNGSASNGSAASQELDATARPEISGHPRVLLVAIKRRHADEPISLLGDVGLKVDVLQSDCVALCNLASYELLQRDHPVAILDIGHSTTNLVISSPDTIWFRSFNLAAGHITNSLVRQFKLTRSSAEQLKRNPITAPRLSQLGDAIQPVFADVAHQIRLSLLSFRKLYPWVSIEQLYGVGGGFQTHGLLRYLRTGS